MKVFLQYQFQRAQQLTSYGLQFWRQINSTALCIACVDGHGWPPICNWPILDNRILLLRIFIQLDTASSASSLQCAEFIYFPDLLSVLQPMVTICSCEGLNDRWYGLQAPPLIWQIVVMNTRKMHARGNYLMSLFHIPYKFINAMLFVPMAFCGKLSLHFSGLLWFAVICQAMYTGQPTWIYKDSC